MKTTLDTQILRLRVASAILTVLLMAPRSGDCQSPITVTDCNLQGWVRQTLPVGSTITFLPGPESAPLGLGSVELYTPQGNVRFRNTSFDHVSLSSLTELGYASYIQLRSNTKDDLYLVLQIDLTGDEIMDEVILFNPRYQTAQWLPPSFPVQEDVQEGVWQQWDALHGAWWLGPAQDPENGGLLFSLADYISGHPTSRIINPGANGTGGIRLQAGGPVGIFGPNFRGNLDDVRIGVDGITTRYDLEYSNKSMVCHNGHELCVSHAAVPAHLAHGDALGPCSLPLMAAPPIPNVSSVNPVSIEGSIYPNPAGESAMLEYQVPLDGDVSFELWDAAGQRKINREEGRQRAGLQSLSVDTFGLPNGIYYWKLKVVTSSDQWMQTGKLTVLH